MLRPAAEWELQSQIKAHHAQRTPLEIVGGGTKRTIGRPSGGAQPITTASLRGITLYEPNELVMAARSGTLLSQIEAELASRNQMLAFEPIDLGPACGGPRSHQTIGGVFAANLSGSRRVMSGAARDHLIGVAAINGRAEVFKSGGRVMKNVTGYDVARALAGSWGTLAVLTEVTFKVLPRPEETATILFFGLPDDLAVELMCAALGTPFEVTGTIHLDAPLAARLRQPALAQAGKAVTALRLENFSRSIAYRKQRLLELLKAYGQSLVLDSPTSLELWSDVRDLRMLPANGTQLWRISTKPTDAPRIVTAIKRYMPLAAFYDWSGGLVWLEVPAAADAGVADIRRVIASHSGHATLIRADESVRAAVDVFQPQDPGVDRIQRSLKAAFDPEGILNRGRMGAGL